MIHGCGCKPRLLLITSFLVKYTCCTIYPYMVGKDKSWCTLTLKTQYTHRMKITTKSNHTAIYTYMWLRNVNNS